jgi:hypothetical protein
MNEKLRQIYDLYKENGLVGNATFEQFANANADQQQAIWELGAENGLVGTAEPDDFKAAFKKEEPGFFAGLFGSDKESANTVSNTMMGKVGAYEPELKKKADSTVSPSEDSSLVLPSKPKDEFQLAAARARGEFVPPTGTLEEQAKAVGGTDSYMGMTVPKAKTYAGKQEVKKEFEKQQEIAASAFDEQAKGTADFNRALSNVNKEMMDFDEEDITPKLQGLFGLYGYKFDYATDAREAVEVTAPNGKKKTIPVDAFTEAGDIESANEFKSFINANKPTLRQTTEQLPYQDRNYNRILNEEEAKQQMANINKITERQDRLDSDLETLSINKAKLAKELNGLVVGSPEYLKKEQQLNQLDNSIAETNKMLDYFNKQDKPLKEKLMASMGSYTKAAAEQGGLLAASYNSALSASGGILAGLNDMVGFLSSRMMEDATTEEKDASYQMVKERSPIIRESLLKAYGITSVSEEYLAAAQENFLKRNVLGAAAFVPQLAGMAAAPEVAIPLFFLGGYDGTMEKMDNNPKFKNVSEAEKFGVATTAGVINSVLMKYNVGEKVLETAAGKALMGNVLKRVGSKTGATTIEEVVDNEVKGALSKGLITAAAGASHGFSLGAQIKVGEIVSEELYNKMKEEKLFDTPETFTEAFHQVMESGLDMAMGSVLLGVPKTFQKSLKENNYQGITSEDLDVLNAYANSSEFLEFKKAQVGQKVASREITKEQGVQEIAALETNISIYKSIPENLSDAGKRKAMGLLSEKRQLDSFIQGKDKALVKKQIDRVAEINKQLEALPDMKEEAPATPEAATPSYSINGKEMSEQEFTKAVSEMSPEDVKKADIKANNATEGVTTLLKEVATRSGVESAPMMQTTAAPEAQPAKPKTIDEIQDEDLKSNLNFRKENLENDLKLDEEDYNKAKENFDSKNPIVRFFSKKPSYEQYTKYSKDRLDLLNNNPEKFLSDEISKYEKYKEEDGEEFDAQDYLDNLKDLQTKLQEENAVQKPTTEEGVLRTEQSQVGLPKMGEGNTQETTAQEGVAPAKPQEITDEARIERRYKNAEILTAEGSTYYNDISFENAKIGDEIHYNEYKDGIFINHKTKVKDIVDGEVIFENGQTQKDVSSYMNITAEDAWFAKNKPTEKAPAKPTEAKPIEQELAELEQMFPTEGPTGENKGVAASDTKAMEEIASRSTDERVQKVVRTAQRLTKTLKSLFPNAEINIHETEESYNGAMEEINATKESNGNFAFGVVDGKPFVRIDINANTASSRDVAHEVAHAVLQKTFGDNQKLFQSFQEKIAKVISTDSNQKLLDFANNPKYREQGVTYEEYMAELKAILSEEGSKIELSTAKKIAAVINEYVSRITKGAFKPFQEVTDVKQVVDFVNKVTEAMAKGEAIDVEAAGKMGKGSRSSIKAFHGSPYEIDKFKTEKIGTGEGAQAFGWGLYFTDLKDIAQGYAGKLSENKIKIGDNEITGEVAKWYLDNKDNIDSAIKELESDIPTLSKPSMFGKKFGEDARTLIDAYNKKEKIEITKTRNVYDVTLHEGKTPDQYTYLEWDKPVSDEQINKIEKQAESENIKIQNLKTAKASYVTRIDSDGSGKFVYRYLEEVLGSPKEASLFLLRAGIDGVKYPAESIARGATSDTARGFNYVIFDENAATINAVSRSSLREGALKDIESTTKALEPLVNEKKSSIGVQLRKLVGLIAHNGSESITKFDPTKIKGQTRGRYGKGFYFSSLFKNFDYGDKSTFLNSKKLNLLNGDMYVSDVIYKLSSPTEINARINKFKELLSKSKNSREYNEILEEINILEEERSSFDENSKYIERALEKAVQEKPKEQFSSFLENLESRVIESNRLNPSRAVQGLNESLNNLLLKSGFDGVSFTEGNEILIIPQEKLNDLIIASQEKAISEAYHKAKEDGSNPKLVKAVEDLLGAGEITSRSSLRTAEQVDKMVKDARASGYSEKAIEEFLKKRGVDQAIVDKSLGKKEAGTKIVTNEEMMPGYDKVMEDVNSEILRGLDRKTKETTIEKNVMKIVEGSEAYKNATDQQKGQMTRDVKEAFGEKMKQAPSAEKITGKEQKKVTVDVAQALKDQIKLEMKAALKGAKSVTEKIKAVKDYFDSVKDSGNLTRKDLTRVMDVIAKVKDEKTLDKAVNKINDIIDKATSDKIEISEKKMIANTIKEVKLAKGNIKEKRKLITDVIDSIKKSGKLTAAQVNALLKRANNLNVESFEHLNKFIDYAEKIFADADYQNKLSKANAERTSIRKSSKNKGNKYNGNLVALGEEFIKIDPSLVEDIEQYNKIASDLEDAIKGSSMKGFKATVDIKTTNAYIEKTMKAQKEKLTDMMREQIEELLGVDGSTLTYDEMLKMLEKKEEDMSEQNEKIIRSAAVKLFESLSSNIDYILKTGKDPFTGEPVDINKSKEKVIRNFMEMDLTKMKIKDAISAVDALNNFIVNQSTAKMDKVFRKYRTERRIESLISSKIKSKILRVYGLRKFGKGLFREFGSETLLMDALFGGTGKGDIVSKAMGLSDAKSNKSEAQTTARNMVVDYVDEFYDKKANGTDFNTAENNVERGMLAFVSRIRLGDEKVSFEDRKSLVDQTIKNLENGSEKEQEKAKLYQEVYDKILKDSKSAQEVRDKVDKANADAVDFWIGKWSENYEELADVSENIHNIV